MLHRILVLSLAACAALLSMPAGSSDAAQVRYPQGWRQWAHVKSMLIEPGHPLAGLVEGLHHVYANPAALRGYKKRPFPDGAVIVFDLLTPMQGERAMTEGARKAVIVMEKNRRKFAATGGWGYEVFGGDSQTDRKVGANAASACHSCHTAQRERDYVFSDWRN
jgi:hypothetical protein